MARINPNWRRLLERYKWIVRVAMLLLAVGNGWEWHRHTAAHNPIVAVSLAAKAEARRMPHPPSIF
jgi:hypothetical protein